MSYFFKISKYSSLGTTSNKTFSPTVLLSFFDSFIHSLFIHSFAHPFVYLFTFSDNHPKCNAYKYLLIQVRVFFNPYCLLIEKVKSSKHCFLEKIWHMKKKVIRKSMSFIRLRYLTTTFLGNWNRKMKLKR